MLHWSCDLRSRALATYVGQEATSDQTILASQHRKKNAIENRRTSNSRNQTSVEIEGSKLRTSPEVNTVDFVENVHHHQFIHSRFKAIFE